MRPAYVGSQGYLSASERESVLEWIQEKTQPTLSEVIDYIEEKYRGVYCSMESDYSLLEEAGMSWHQGKKKSAL